MSQQKDRLKNSTSDTGRHAKSGTRSPVRADRPRRSISVVYWFVFLCMVGLWAVLFGTQFSEFVTISDRTQEEIRQTVNKDQNSAEGEVQGVGDSVGEIDAEPLSETQRLSMEEETTVAQVEQVVDEIEQERVQKLRDTLLLQLPYETDNPNLPVTFVEPTETGVEVQIDGGGFSLVKSPYLLPSLSVGSHVLNFRFNDENEETQNLEETIIVIPRPPVWAEGLKTQYKKDEPVALEGTALPRSTVLVLVGSSVVTEQTEADADGAWSITVSQELGSGNHTALSMVRKDGYASNFSEAYVFSVGEVEGASVEPAAADGDQDDRRRIDTTPFLNVLDRYVTEDTYVYVLGGAGLVVVLLLIVLSALMSRAAKSSVPRGNWLSNVEKKDVAEDAPGKLSLREKFASAGLRVGSGNGIVPQKDERREEIKENPNNEPENVPNDVVTEEKEKEVVAVVPKRHEKEMKREIPPRPRERPLTKKVYSREEFMKSFKTSAGDDNSKETNRIKISLTSRDGK
ncbi:MAG: hypothetical protein PHG63_00185 [Candidatus Dojkabacteria bacterium]|nr:hypothetical protein [Candidatus Dojkabacteria bacterium]